MPKELTIYQNYPNPFNPFTTLKYDLPEDTYVKIIIYDMLGNTVKILLDSYLNSGRKSVQWDGTNDQANKVSAGLYFYRIEAGDFSKTKKMIMLK